MNYSLQVAQLQKGQMYRCCATSAAGNNNDVNMFVGLTPSNEPMFTNDRFKANFILSPNIWTFYKA